MIYFTTKIRYDKTTDDGTIESKLVDTDLSVSCENYNCEADLRNWIDSEINDGNIHGVTWFDKL